MNIKLKLLLRIIMAAFAFIPVLIISIVGMVSINGFSSSMLKEEVGVLGYSQSTAIVTVLDEYDANITSLAKFDSVVSVLNGDQSNKADITEITSDIKSLNENIKDIVIMNSEGNVIISDVNSTTDSLFFGFGDEMKSGGKTSYYVSDIYIGNETYGGNVFYISRQIRSGENTIGYVAQVVSTDEILAALKKAAFFRTGNLFVADSKGTLINYQGADITRLDTVTNGGVKGRLGEIIGKQANVSTNYADFSTGGFIGGYNNINGTNWLWCAVYPGGNAASLVMMTLIIGIVGMLVIMALEALLIIQETRKIINPMTDMIEKMKLIKSGERNERFVVHTSNEFGRMADTFNTMLDEAVLSEELHRTISDISDNMLFEWDFVKERMYVSDNLKAKFDIDASQATLINGRFIESLMSPEMAEQYKKDMNMLLKNRDNFGGEYEVTAKGGQQVWISMRTLCITDRLGELLRIIGVITDIDSEKKLTLQLSERASYDFLSSLYNRNTFERELQAELDRSASSKIAVLFIDIDDFKFTNDRFGHTVGDEVIKYVADKLNDRVKDYGFAGRFGGDEFVLCVRDKKLIENVENMAMDIIDELYNGYYSTAVNATLNIKASVGIAISPEHGTESTTLVGAADEAMYFVKRNGKANYHIYDPADTETLAMMDQI